MKLVDLSVLVENTPAEPMKIKSKRLDHRTGAKKVAKESHMPPRMPWQKKLGAFIRYSMGRTTMKDTDFPGGEFLTLDTVTMPTHMGTHLDAPIHYGSMCENKPSRSVDELPLEWFYGRGVKLDLRYKKAAEWITVDDIQQALEQAEHELKPFDIVLIWTGTDRKWGTPAYFLEAPGMSKEATAYLTERGIKVIGIDTYGFDRPFGVMLREFHRTQDQDVLWPAHFYGREKEYVQIERLANLTALPATGFHVSCFPIKIKGADASWIRAVGLVEE
jgi:kynurenine formamidase